MTAASVSLTFSLTIGIIQRMLDYLGWGVRQYGERPAPVRIRHRWEFQAVLAGSCAPWLPAAPCLPWKSNRLWIFAPQCPHGWRAEPGSRCEVAVAHFSDVPHELSDWMGAQEYVEVELTADACQEVAQRIQSLEADYRRPGALSNLRGQRVLLDLVLLALEALPRRLPLAGGSRPQRVAAQAMAWFEENMASSPGVAEVARAAHVSPSHLRRLFWEARQESPISAMRRAQINQARELMARTDQPIKQIAAACGFSATSVFSRVFHQLTRSSPTDWRTRHRPTPTP